MGCFTCFDIGKQDKKPLNLQKDGAFMQPRMPPPLRRLPSDKMTLKSAETTDSLQEAPQPITTAQTFTFRELAAATGNFRSDLLIGEGGFGRVYKGRFEGTGQIVAVKQLDRDGLQGNREFLVEVLMLSLLHHPNLVNLIGYCADGDQRLLVYEYMSLGSLEDHLHDLTPGTESLDWSIRMKIAAGAARGMEYLHDKANPPVIYRDFKSSNILLDEGFHPKLSDFGLAKLGPVGDKTHVSTRVMGTYGYCAPEYALTGQLTIKSDVYSFGVVLLELITGRRAIDESRRPGEQNLVSWAQPLFKDRKKFHHLADPSLHGRYPMRGLYQAIAVAAMCLQEDAANRPSTADVVTALNYLASQEYDPKVHPIEKLSPSSRDKKEKEKRPRNGNKQGANEGGFVERMSPRGSSHSPALNSLDTCDVVIQQARVHHSPDNRRLREVGSASNSPDMGRQGNGLSWLNGVQAAGVQDSLHGKKQDMEEELAPQQAGRISKSASDREKAVAEARLWGENWREKKRGNLSNFNSVLV